MSEAKYETKVDNASEEKKTLSSSNIDEDDQKQRNDDILEKVKVYFYEDESFSKLFETFAMDHCDIFDLGEEEEMKLEYTTLHKKFLALFEDTIEGFIESHGWTVSHFYTIVQDAVERDPEGNESLFAQIMVATTDFDIFVQLMKEAREQKASAVAESKE